MANIHAKIILGQNVKVSTESPAELIFVFAEGLNLPFIRLRCIIKGRAIHTKSPQEIS